MRYWLGAAFAFLVALLQASSVQQFQAFGVAPNLVLVMLVCWLVVRGLDDVLPMVAVAGVTVGLVGLQTPGLVLLALILPVAALGLLREMHVIHSDLVMALAFVVVASVIYETVMTAGVMATGGVFDVEGGFRDAVLPAAAVNLVIAPPVFVLMRLAKPHERRGRLSY